VSSKQSLDARPAGRDALLAAHVVARRVAGVVRRFVEALLEHDAFAAAASTAFWIFLSLVPLLVLIGFLVGLVARSRGVDALIGPILEIAPGAAEGLVGSELQRLAGGHASSIAPVGVAGFLWTASSGLHVLMDVLENAVKAERRAWWKQRVFALGWVIVGLVMACSLAWVLVKTDNLINAYESPSSAPSSAASSPSSPAAGAPGRERPGPGERSAAGGHAGATHPAAIGASPSQAAPGTTAAPSRPKSNLRKRMRKALTTPDEKLITAVLVLLAGAAFLAGFYRFAVVHPPGIRRHVWPGAAAAIVSWLFVSWAFGDYAVSIADSYALYYGSLAAVAVLLLWLYLSSLSLIVGAEVNAQLEGLRDGRSPRPGKSGGPPRAALR
jgi:uncharacterized BrkB/YihY/UPF0761 family membrane protein